jgi:hypothetical protein
MLLGLYVPSIQVSRYRYDGLYIVEHVTCIQFSLNLPSMTLSPLQASYEKGISGKMICRFRFRVSQKLENFPRMHAHSPG